MITDAVVRDVLAKVVDPALGHDIMSYRMVRTVEVQGDDVLVRIDLPTHAYPLAQRRELVVKIEQAVKAAGGKRVTVLPEVDDRVPAGAERQGGAEGAQERDRGGGRQGRRRQVDGGGQPRARAGAPRGQGRPARCRRVRPVDPDDARRARGAGVGDQGLADHPGDPPRAARDQRRLLRRQGRGGRLARPDGAPPAPAVPGRRRLGRARLPGVRPAARHRRRPALAVAADPDHRRGHGDDAAGGRDRRRRARASRCSRRSRSRSSGSSRT